MIGPGILTLERPAVTARHNSRSEFLNFETATIFRVSAILG